MMGNPRGQEPMTDARREAIVRWADENGKPLTFIDSRGCHPVPMGAGRLSHSLIGRAHCLDRVLAEMRLGRWTPPPERPRTLWVKEEGPPPLTPETVRKLVDVVWNVNDNVSIHNKADI